MTCVLLCCLAAQKSRGVAVETGRPFLLLFKGVCGGQLPAGRDLVFELPEGSYMLTRCLVGAGVVRVESQGQRGQQAKWEVGTCAVPCREGCGRGPDGVKGWQGQEGQR